ncbi:MAG: DMT family transporter [Clostridia bacterium]
MKFKSWQADLSLLFVAAIWGSTFVIVKQATTDMPPFTFLSIRFGIAAITLFLLKPKFATWKNKQLWKKGIFIGIFLFFGYAFQTFGLQYTSAAKTGFITGLYVIIVPLIVAIADKKLPTKLTFLGIILATFGLGLLSLEGFSISHGDLLVLICSFAFAIHIYSIDQLGGNEDTIAITTIQLLTVSVLSFIGASLFEPIASISWSRNVYLGLALTAIPATSIAFLLQNKFQKYTTPTHTALIFASEPVFSYIFAFILVGEVLTTKYTIGAILILSGILLSELKLKKRESI